MLPRYRSSEYLWEEWRLHRDCTRSERQRLRCRKNGMLCVAFSRDVKAGLRRRARMTGL